MRATRVAAPLLGLVLGAAVLWGSSRLTWLSADVYAEHLGQFTRALTGAQWAPEVIAIALGLAAVAIAMAFTRGRLAQVVALIGLGLALGAGASALLTLSGKADTSRVHSVVTAHEDIAPTTSGSTRGQPEAVPEWAVITGTQVSAGGPTVAVAGAALACAASLFAFIKPRRAAATSDKYRTPKQRQQVARAQRSAVVTQVSDADADRLLWDSLDAGDDPTAEYPDNECGISDDKEN